MNSTSSEPYLAQRGPLMPTNGLFAVSDMAEAVQGGDFKPCPKCGVIIEAVVGTCISCWKADARACEGTKRLPPPTTAQEFAQFHAANPHVYDLLVRLARDARRSGIVRGIKGLMEDARSMAGLQTDGKPFKLDNSFTAYYARLIMAQEPELAGYFRLRYCRGDA